MLEEISVQPHQLRNRCNWYAPRCCAVIRQTFLIWLASVRVWNRIAGQSQHCSLFRLATVTLFLLVGCKHTPQQTMSGLWESVPQVRWSGTRPDPALPVPKAEPSVAANTGASVAKSQSSSPSSPNADAEVARGVGQAKAIRTVGNVEPPKQTMDGEFPGGDFENNTPTQTNSPSSEFGLTERGQDQIEKLRAALDNDAVQVEGSPRNAGNTHDVRVRVDSLVEKARSLFDLGQLREARHTAKIAHDLGDAARLDYSPEEERPIDLVQRIDDRIKETTEIADNLETGSDQQMVDGPSSEKRQQEIALTPPSTTTLGKQLPAARPADTDANNRRKDWTQGLSVFRRDRKPTPTAVPGAISHPTVAATPSATDTTTIPIGVEFSAEPIEANESAVVQANRSLSLARPGVESSLEEQESDVERYGDTLDDYNARGESAESASSAEANRNSPLFKADTVSWSEVAVTPRVLNIEESTPPPVDFAEVEPLAPFRDVTGASTASVVSEKATDAPRPVDRSWAIAVALFTACTIVAIFWYRRGAV